MTKVLGSSWAVDVTYACRCGTHYRATRWRWIDRETMAEEADRCRVDGPLRGQCPSCSTPASARTHWLEIEPSRERAVLYLGPHQRHQLVEALAEHLEGVRARVEAGALMHAGPWLLRPLWHFDDSTTSAVTAIREVNPRLLGSDHEDTAKRRAPTGSGVPKIVGAHPWPAPVPASEAPDTYLTMLSMDLGAASGQDDEEIVTIDLVLDEPGRALWGQAALQVRPIHLREHGYPLIGVRLVASYLGRMSLIDGIVDVGSERAAEIFGALSRRFRVQLVLRGDGVTSVVRREVSARDLERNAALCLESARAALARSEYPREAFASALEHLRETPLEDRLTGAPQTLVAGAYRHLISPRETWVALEHLEASSDKKNLAHLLEVDGLSVDEYEAIRRRVLVASVEHGLCAPRRFWRRIIASGLADDFNDYASRLARARAEADQDGDDLDTEQRAASWSRIAELCDLKQLEYPVELVRKLGLEADRPRHRGGTEPSGRQLSRREPGVGRRVAAGEILARPGGRDGSGNLREQLRDPQMRLRVATAALANGGTPESLEAVFSALEEFDEEELLAIMPSLAELGTQAVPALHAKLGSPRQQVRHAAVILLGIARDASSIVPLIRRLTQEDTRVWFDVARAIGALGTTALERLCALLRQSKRGEQFPIEHRELIGRAGRAMAEVVIAGGGPDGIARDAVEALAQSSETDIALAAGRALATLHDVSVAGAQIRGERSLPDITQLRGFARRAYEAILVPELDILDEEVEAELL
ncbi:hypothetical protein G6O69_30610 [Pseudenhygromyxa sp. WMMC2535]|uniref:HEAT repeat domain-containing protein n=1 Tax=Pseudenhygromyxa sp. WMMC2535 TaxID=2712867 RepID=UPI001551CB87|nr:HEAT repeat domain-containing protein [Pseudenhygromyxa sp. WMMC2535]NVB42215.1 hypothetical protein [Pseudenhygromyxa sp. WMMC2535]